MSAETSQPPVSIVLVGDGGGAAAERALRLLHENTGPAHEVIDVRRKALDGNSSGVGFATAANMGAARARGRHLVFLSNDAQVTPGWLEPLLDVVEGTPGVGVVAPLAIREGGSIENAGGLVFRDGSLAAWGQGLEAGGAEFRFRRAIDWGCPACLLVRRDDFWKVGGFCPDYDDSRYTALDLSLALAEAGRVTVYEPLSVVEHSGATAVDRSDEEKSRLMLLRRWSGPLLCRPAPPVEPFGFRALLEARDAPAPSRILILEDRVPFHDRGSGDPRIWRFLKELTSLWPSVHVTFVANDRPAESESYAEQLLGLGIDVVQARRDLEAWLAERRHHYDLVVVCRPKTRQTWEAIRETQPRALVAYDMEALFFRRLQGMKGFVENEARAREIEVALDYYRDLEIWQILSTDALFLVSREEQRLVEGLAPDKQVFYLPYAVDVVKRPPGFQERHDLLFFGGFMGGAGSPNEDAVAYLVEKVLPIIRSKLPDVVLNVVGADPTPAVYRLHGDGVNVVGYVADPTPWLLRSRLLIVPLRYGAGVKLRCVEAMAAGLPFVASPAAAEGLPLEGLRSQVVGETPFEIASRSLRLYSDEALWRRVQAAMLETAAAHFGSQVYRRNLVDAMAHLGVAPPARSGDGTYASG